MNKKSEDEKNSAKIVRQAAKLHRKSRIYKREKWLSRAFLSPSFIGILLFFLVPFVIIIYYSMVDNPLDGTFVFLDNFISLLQNSAFLQASKNTMLFSVIIVPLAVIISLLLAILLEQNIPWRSQFRTFFLSPMMVPIASIVLIWQVLFEYNGAINELMVNLGFDKVDWFKSSFSMIVIVILFLWKNLGYNMILFMAALNAIPQTVVESAIVDGANPVQLFTHIKIRYLSPTILFVGILSLINSFKVFREVYLLTGDYPYDSLYMLQHFMNNTFRSLDYQKLSAAAIIMCVVMIVIIGVLFMVENYFGKDVEG